MVGSNGPDWAVWKAFSFILEGLVLDACIMVIAIGGIGSLAVRRERG